MGCDIIMLLSFSLSSVCHFVGYLLLLCRHLLLSATYECYNVSYISACVKKSSLSSDRSIGDGDAAVFLVSFISSSNFSYSCSEVQAAICAIICCFLAKKVSCLVIAAGLGVLQYCGLFTKNWSTAIWSQPWRLVFVHHLVLYFLTNMGIWKLSIIWS
ncbi:hypothetical protein MANES_01G049540v8 [Manihot esculenta]|uniref:Uncharacterized protein n=1 Tax=Manihot esculenta TaxID=3983 RepID=A0ACB7IAP8_MANES|nr:hypothetical protein MANES_01G049540v8 [Manihot esculenta]